MQILKNLDIFLMYYVIVSRRNMAIATKNVFYIGLAVLKKRANMLMLSMCLTARYHLARK